jgi:hypothetical protein
MHRMLHSHQRPQKAEQARDSNANLLFTRQARIVRRVLASGLLAAHVRWVVQLVRSHRAE